MSQKSSLEQSYLTLFRFLLLSKHLVFELGGKYGLSGMQTMMLIMLDQPRQMNNCRQLFNCDASNITGIVDGLEQKKLATRFEDSTDRRVKMVKITPCGQRLRTALLDSFMNRNTPPLSQLNSRELKTFVELLQKITLGVQNV